jgi:hypothetical protein
MDLRTGRTYETREAAIAAGVPEADIVELTRTGPRFQRLGPTVRREYATPVGNPLHPVRHQGTRERARRLARMGSE